jgi:glutamate-1-semialdehyde 2,1-aminomutase
MNEKNNQALYKRAREIIPGGNQLLSKRPEMFLPEHWPSYFSKASGVEIWDLEKNHYFDMSIMGIGTCSLGYANPHVNDAVIKAISNGSMSTLNSWEEVTLAETLIELHPGMEMVRFARTGGEANAIAIRVARAASGRELTAVCGYHGWHDWYLAANLVRPDSLKGLLLPGLKPEGLPPQLSGTTLTFQYGDIEGIERIASEHNEQLGVICVEVQRGREPDLKFLKKIQDIGRSIGAVVIFDEISSGFRLSIGGIYKNYGLAPDMVVLGKALGNGYAVSAALGKRHVMEAAQGSFISSSYWTERTGFAAALETIRQFEKQDGISQLTALGECFSTEVGASLKESGLDIEVDGMITVPLLRINEIDPLAVKTFLTQELLKLGYLASPNIYLSTAHSEKLIKDYAADLASVGKRLRLLLDNQELRSAIDGPICHSGFQRLT